MLKPPTRLRGISEIRSWFFQDRTPYWHVCASPSTLQGMDEWVRGFRWVSYTDCFDGAHPRVFVPPTEHLEVFPDNTLEEMTTRLLARADVQERIRAAGPGRLGMLMFDEQTEELARQLDLQLIFPSAALRRRVDDKVETTRLGDRAGVPSVPCALGAVRNWEDLMGVAGHLGPDLVIQTPYGDSGTTTYFVSSPEDLDSCLEKVAAEPEVKVMKRIRCAQGAIEACVTSAGTLVGPMQTEIVGFGELTPYRGGWAGNEVAPAAFTDEQRALASSRTGAFGDVLRSIGYRGYFEIDWLIDLDDGELYLGEVNPRLTGASPLTNLSAMAHADAPLFLFHLLEFTDIPFELDVDALNKRWLLSEYDDAWGQLIIKHVAPETIALTAAPSSGVWRMGDDQQISYRNMQVHRRTVQDEEHAFFLRMARVGEHVDHGDDIGVLVARGRLMTPDRQLTPRAQAWIRAIRGQFAGHPLPA